MAKIKLTKTAVESAQPQAKDIELRDTVVPGFLCKITSTGRRVFMLQYRTNSGQPRKPSLGLYGELTVEQARVKAQDWLAEVRRGGDPGGAKAEARKAPTMAELCKKFMEDYSKKRNKVSTQDGYQGVIDRNIIPLLGRKKVHDVKRPDIAGLMEKLAYKPTEANKTFGVLRKMFDLAEVWGFRPDGTNPCRHVPMYPPGKETRLIVDEEMVPEDLPPVGETGGGGAGELRHPVGDPAAIRVCGAALRNLPARMELAGLQREPARGVARQQGWRHFQAHERGSLSAAFDGAASGRLPLRPAVAERPGQAPDLWRALWRRVPDAQGRQRAARRHARHPSSLDHRHCQFRCADQSGNEADGPQDRGDVHALRPHRGQAVREAAELVASRRQAITGARQLAEAVA